MIPDGFPNSLGFMNLGGGGMLSLIMQVSFFGVLLFTSISLLISFLHLIWYSTNSFRSYLALIIFVLVATPIFLFAFKIMPDVVFKLTI